MRFATRLGFYAATLAFMVGCSQLPVYLAQETVAPPAPQQARSSERLGTQWGEGISSDVVNVDLWRVSSQPVDVIEVRYSAANYRGRAIREAMLAEGRIGLSILDDKNRKWELTQDERKLYLKGNNGERYQLFYQNYSQATYEIVATVDGLDVLDGSSGSLSSRGYVLYPNSTLLIEGFRKNQHEVAAFRFSAPRDAYAANTEAGSSANIGVIGTAVFALNTPPPRHAPATQQSPQTFPADNPRSNYAPPPNYQR
ncbi:MAG: hypothetical protein LBS89_07920 [Zoogloeaceae bacterium]|jgi:hypothetical protein|nr:hypothetical protein [Zoogloeaceae bacterium]